MMTTLRNTALLFAAAALGVAPGCSKSKSTSGSGGGGSVASASGSSAPALKPIGVTDPAPRINGATEKQLRAGNKAMNAKKWADAQDAYRQVLAAAPDYLPARWLLVRALVLGGNHADVPAQVEELFARAYVSYATKMDKGREFAALRAAPEWARIGELKARYRDAWAAGLDKGVVFVARLRPSGSELRQEAFHYDPATKRLRQISETGGHVFALHRTPNGKMLTLFLVDKADKVFANSRVAFVDLATLDQVGPLPFEESGFVMLGANAAGAPLVCSAEDESEKCFTLDTARTGLAEVQEHEFAGGHTVAQPEEVAFSNPHDVDGVKVADSSFTVAGSDTPVTSSRKLSSSSFDWSPNRARITYAGELDPCKAEKNELFVYDKTKKSAQRIAQAVSYFETSWLSDDQLVYETGVGKDGRINIYDFVAHAPTTLPTRYGAGLYGVPTLACQPPDDASDAADGDDVPGE